MRRAAQANWSRLPNHNPPRFYTAWTHSGPWVSWIATTQKAGKRTLNRASKLSLRELTTTRDHPKELSRVFAFFKSAVSKPSVKPA